MNLADALRTYLGDLLEAFDNAVTDPTEETP
jgi:hypothetical protein